MLVACSSFLENEEASEGEWNEPVAQPGLEHCSYMKSVR